MVGTKLDCTLATRIVVVSTRGIGQPWSHTIIQALFWKVINCDPVDRAFCFLELTECCQGQNSQRYSKLNNIISLIH